jgi:hypothetical protein
VANPTTHRNDGKQRKSLPKPGWNCENLFMKANPMKRSVLIAALFSVCVAPFVFSKPDKEKVTLCHRGHTITVAEAALPAHLAHGDLVGPCETTEVRR